MSWIWLIFPPHFSKKETYRGHGIYFQIRWFNLIMKAHSQHSLFLGSLWKSMYYNSTLPDKKLKCADYRKLSLIQEKSRFGGGIMGRTLEVRQIYVWKLNCVTWNNTSNSPRWPFSLPSRRSLPGTLSLRRSFSGSTSFSLPFTTSVIFSVRHLISSVIPPWKSGWWI